AIAAVELGQEPTRFLSTVQIGITSIGILNGIIGEGALAQPLSAWLKQMGMEAKPAGYAATAIVVVGITYFSIVLGELVPKRLGQLAAEGIARAVSRPLKLLSAITKPFVLLLAGSTDFLLKLMPVREHGEQEVEEEIHALMRAGSESGEIEKDEHQMVRNVFRLDDRALGSLMVPRSEIVTLDAGVAWGQNVERIEEGDHTRFPVLRGGWHDVAGVVSARTLLRKLLKGETPDLNSGIGAPVFVPESLSGLELLQNFRASGTQMAFVIDEYGEVQGMVTLRDVMEAITGEFKPRDVEDSWAIQREDGSWLLDGLIPIPELKDRLSLHEVPEEDKGAYHTLSGMMMLLLGRLPRTTDRVEWEGWTLEVVDIDGKRVDKVLAAPVKPPEEGAGEGGGEKDWA
ncbi:MAG TPA: hemolysin family protein, partial [Burkholderiales bacterium]